MTLANQTIRKYARDKGVCLWEVADYLEISEPSMTRKLRKELSDTERDNILSIIDKVAESKSKTATA